MSKALPLILVAVCVAVCTWVATAIYMERGFVPERNAAQHQADSLRSVIDQREAQLKIGDSLRAAMKAELDSARLVRKPLNTVIDDFTKAAFNAGLDSMQRIHWTDPQ